MLKMYKRYGLFGLIRVVKSLIFTKIFYPKARLIRLPFDIRNKKFISIGKGFTSGFGCRIEALEIPNQKAPLLSFGKNIQINDYVHIACGESIIISDNVLIASKVFITDINHGNYANDNSDSPNTLPNDRSLYTKPIIIEENVWIGENVCVMPGVKIGFGCIIGAGAIVTKNIEANSIAVGNPAKIIKKFNPLEKRWQIVG